MQCLACLLRFVHHPAELFVLIQIAILNRLVNACQALVDNTAGTDIWTPIAAGTSSIFEGPLGGEGSGVWDTSQLEPGDYRLRLVVVDNVNNVYPPCVISVRIAAP